MLRRKIEHILETWKISKDHNPLIIKGCRECGKTYSVLDFAKKNYKHVVYLDFYQNEAYKAAFSDSLEVDYIVMMITSLMGNKAIFIPHDTILILDEIQECPEARTALKYFKIDGRYDVIGTETKGFENNQTSPIPVGYETIIDMYPLDFEEFLWANGISEGVIEILKNCLEKESVVPEAIHNRMKELLLQYIVVGGLPRVVTKFFETKNMNDVIYVQQSIIKSYEYDMIKYAKKCDKSKILECFHSLPSQLSKENKKFQYSIIKKGGRASFYEGSLQWIEDGGIIRRCYNLSITELPLQGNKEKDVFKVYMQDIGLLVSMLDEGTQGDILQGNLLGYKGAIFENLIADIFNKMGRKLYYYHKDSGLEVDFVIRYKGECVLVDVKPSNKNRKNLKTILNNQKLYHVNHAIKMGDYNIERNDKVLSLPLYMAFLLREY